MASFKAKILVVDPDAEDRGRLRLLLDSAYCLLEAEHAGQAAQILERNPDVLLAILQPGLLERCGPALTDRLSGIPIVLFQEGERPAADPLALLRLGSVVGVLKKPFEPELARAYLKNLTGVLLSENQWDEVTGLYNRGKFLRKTEAALQEHPEKRYLVGCLNIRGFRLINDLYEASTGDRVLRAVSDGIRRTLTVPDSVFGRLEADKFVFCSPSGSFSPQQMLDNLDKACARCALEHSVVILMGLYEVEPGHPPVSQMCDRALMAMGTIDETAPVRYAYFDEEQRRRLLREQEITGEMERAVETGQFQIYLQPIYSLSTQRPVSAEALVRWVHPEKGLIPPDQFIPLFERNGFIAELDYAVWEQAFAFLAELRRQGRTHFPVSVNVSRVDLYDPDRTYDRLVGLAQKYGVPPALCHLEITETAYMENPRQFLSAADRLRTAGFSLVMDDFGSGYSSLNMLTQIPADTLKLDMGFVQSLAESGRSRSIVDSVIRMAKWLEMSVVAEGVETQAQLSYLRSIGCDRVQGYYYSRPLPLDQFRALLAQGVPAGHESEPEPDEALDLSELWDSLLESNRRYHGIMGAMGIYELFGDSLEITYVNDAYYELFHRTPDTAFSTVKNALAWVFPEDRPALMKALRAAQEEKKTQLALVREYTRSGAVMWISVGISFLGRRADREFFCLAIRDVTHLTHDQAQSKDPAPPPAACGVQESILIVDDNSINRGILREILGETYTVLEAENGKQALELAQACPNIRAILLDLLMPVMDGLEFLRIRRDSPGLMQIPVLVLSASDHSFTEGKANELGADGFLRKPYDGDKILRSLKSITGAGA